MDNEFDGIKIQNPNSSSTDEEGYNVIPSGTYPRDISLSERGASNETPDMIRFGEDISSITQKAREYLDKYQSKDQADQALSALHKIDSLLVGYGDLNLPEFGISESEDGSLGISWIFPNALFGIVIQPNTKESSWFLISGDVEKGFKADGNLNDLDFELHLAPLFDILRKLQIRIRK